MTADELATSPKKLIVKDNDATPEDLSTSKQEDRKVQCDSNPAFEVNKAIFDQLQIFFPAKTSSQKSAVLLLAPQSQKPQFGYPQFFDAIVKYFAHINGADLITLNMEDIADMVQIILCREGKPLAPYFYGDLDICFQTSATPDNTTHPRFSFAYLFRRAVELKSSHTNRPLVIHVPEAHNLELYSQSINGSPNARKRLLDLMQSAIFQQLPQERQIFFIISSHQLQYQQLSAPNTNSSLVRDCHYFGQYITIAPIRTPSQIKFIQNGLPGFNLIKYQNTKWLRWRIRGITRDCFSPAIQPYARWEFVDECESLNSFLTQQFHFNGRIPVLWVIANEISSNHLDLLHIKTVLMAAAERQRILGSWRAGESEEDENGPWSKFSPQVRARIRHVERQNGFEREKQLLQYLVKPGALDSGWSDIEVDDYIKDAVLQLVGQFTITDRPRRGILSRKRIGGALLYGPPGTGKTHLARVIARECEVIMISVSSAEISDKYIGESEKTIQALFSLGRLLYPSAIFIDEADSLLETRCSDQKGWERSRINQFLGEMDGLVKQDNSPMVLLATNFPQKLDNAVLRRVPFKIHIGLPRNTARERMLRLFLRDDPLYDDVNLTELAWRTVGYSGSDIETLCLQAALIREADPHEAHTVGVRMMRQAHFEEALKRTAPTVTKDALAQIRRFAAENDPNAYQRMGLPDLDQHQHQLASIYAQPQPGAPAPLAIGPNDHIRNQEKTVAKEEKSTTDKPELMPLYSPLDPKSRQIRVLSVDAEARSDGDPEGKSSAPRWKLETVSLFDMMESHLPVFAAKQVMQIVPAISQAISGSHLEQAFEFWKINGGNEEAKSVIGSEAETGGVDGNKEETEEAQEPEPTKKSRQPRYKWGDYVAMSYTWVSYVL